MLSACSFEHLQTDVKYENCFLRCNLFKTFKQHSNYKSLIAKTVDGNTLKMKASSPIQVIENKKQCFSNCFSSRRAIWFSASVFLRARHLPASKITSKFVALKLYLLKDFLKICEPPRLMLSYEISKSFTTAIQRNKAASALSPSSSSF